MTASCTAGLFFPWNLSSLRGDGKAGKGRRRCACGSVGGKGGSDPLAEQARPALALEPAWFPAGGGGEARLSERLGGGVSFPALLQGGLSHPPKSVLGPG